MKSGTRPLVERLEDRCCPALTATLNGSVLTIAGFAVNGAINVNQSNTTAGTISVFDGDPTVPANAVGSSPFAGVKSIKLNLTDAADNVNVDLGGQTLTGKITANLGGGADNVIVKNGTLTGTLKVNYDDGDSDRFHSWCGYRRHRSEPDPDTGLDTVNIQDGATVGKVDVRGGQAGTNVTIAGDVTGWVDVDAWFRSGTTAGSSLAITGEVDGWVNFDGSKLNDTVNIAGPIGGTVWAWTYDGEDTVTVTGAVTGRLDIDTGAGGDNVTVSSIVAKRADIWTGSGNDTVTVTATANLQGKTNVRLKSGTDTFTLADAATITTLIANGGTDTDTYNGLNPRPGLTLVSFP